MEEIIGTEFLADLPVRDSSFTEKFISIRNLGVFYSGGYTNQKEIKLHGLRKSIELAFSERIKSPISNWVSNPKDCFFKPYSSPEAGNSILFGLILPISAVISGLSLIVLHTANPVSLLVHFCLPSIIELIAGLIGLGQALVHQLTALYHINDEQAYNKERINSNLYFDDALTRFALVIPLAVVSLAATPLDLVRFFTRGLSTLINGLEIENEAEDIKDHKNSHSQLF